MDGFRFIVFNAIFNTTSVMVSFIGGGIRCTRGKLPTSRNH